MRVMMKMIKMMDDFLTSTSVTSHCPLPLPHPFLHSSMTLIQPLCSPSPSLSRSFLCSLFSSFRHLDLSNNSITTLPKDTLMTAPLLETLVLQDNPWSCDCRMSWFLTWSLSHPGDYHALVSHIQPFYFYAFEPKTNS